MCGCNYAPSDRTTTITNCYNTGAVSGTGLYVGGVCGDNDVYYSDNGTATITNCYNRGTVSGSGNYVGGVCGKNNAYKSSNGTATITNCYNTGNVTATGTVNDYVGGVCGYNAATDSSNDTVTITNCYNTGNVTATGTGNDYVGGVCGYNATAADAHVTTITNVTTTITNCYNTGAVSGTSYVGGVCGENFSWGGTATITNCYYNTGFCSAGGINGSDVEGIATGKTTAELCGSLDDLGFDSAVWTAGSVGDVTEKVGNYGKITYTFLSLNGVGSAFTLEANVYNFGTNGSDDWQSYTEISTAEELIALSNNSSKWSGNYVLTDDITLTAPAAGSSNWTAIGNGTTKFTGKFSGDGHTISGIVINKSGEDYQGLFGYSKGTIMNVGVINSSISGKDYVGGVCGYNMDGTIKNCYNTGTVSGTNTVGGVCGGKYNCTITNCYNTGTVSGTGDRVGGVCGLNDRGSIENCYNTGAVSGSSVIGGICGFNKQGTITNCYYDTDFYTGNAISENNGTATNVIGISTADLCGSTLPDGFDSGVWTAGSVSDVTEIVGNFGKKTYTFPSLIGVGSAFTLEANVYNFGTNEAPDWQTYTEISTADELIALSNDSTKWGGNYVLTADITLTAPAEAGGSNWTAIGTPTAPFTGKFSGDGHTISGIVINSTSPYQGLFGYLYRNGTIMNVGVINSSISGGNYVGGVCGENDGTIKNCYSTGAVSGTYTVGGVCGVNYGGSIENCYSTGAVSGTGTVGGVCGENDSTIKNCYSTGTVSGESRVGGVCGANYDGSIENCYNTGTVSGSSNVGGVCGANNRGSTENCYYLEGCSADGTTFTSTEGTSKTETQFKNGSVCYLLNGSTSTNPVWYQLLETENYPNLDSTNSANRTVYPRTPCTGVFSNTEGQTAEHSFVVDTNDSTKHICENCGETHDAEFTADDTADTISICHGFGTVTLKAPTENLTYDGTEKAAAVEGELTGFDTPKILYKLKDSAEAAVETAPINAGTYVASITYTDADSNEHSVSVEYTIAKAAVTITANSYTIKVGDTLPTFDYKVSGLVNNETLPITVIVSCTAADSKTAGEYPITVSGADESVNYTFNYVDGTLTVQKKSSGGGGGGGYRPTTPTEPNYPSIGGASKSWSDIAAYLATLPIGSEVTIELNGNTTVPAEVIKVIDERDIKVTFVVDSAKSWKTDGAKISASAEADLSIITTSKLKTDALRGVEGIQFTMNNTNIPTDLSVAFKAAHAGKFANLYKSIDGKLVFVTCAKIGADGKVILPDVVEKGDYVAMLCEFSDRPGDMNNDGVLSAADASVILKQVISVADGKNPLVADINGDGKVTAADAAEILKRIVGLA